MEPRVIGLLALAACMHSLWNLQAKKSLDKQVFLWLSLVISSAIYLIPFALFYTPISATGWGFIFASGIAEAAYYMILAAAYQRGDLSLVYPVARGSAPLFVVLGAYAFLGEKVSLLGMCGVLLAVSGVYVLHIKGMSLQGFMAPLTSLREPGSRLALVTGMTIATYSVMDKAGLKHAQPFPYLYLVFVVSVALLAPYMLTRKRDAVKAEWQANRRSVIFVAVANVATYLVVLFAMTLSKVSYVSSAREMSVVFGALLGSLVLKEPFGKQKIAGASLMFLGVLLISLAR